MLINLRNALMAGKRLPYDAEVEFLESTGTGSTLAWVDTGIPNTANIRVEATARCVATSLYNTIDLYVFGSGWGANRGVAYGIVYSDFWTNLGKCMLLTRGGKGGSFSPDMGTSITGDGQFHYFVYETNDSMSSITVDNGTPFVITTPRYVNGRTYGVFGPRDNETSSGIAQIAQLKIYDANGVLVRDFIPVRKGTVGYLYDRVSGKLFGNAGTGDFALGPDVVPVEWMQSDDKQYIDTGFVATSTTKVQSSCALLRAVSAYPAMWGARTTSRVNDFQIYYNTSTAGGTPTEIVLRTGTSDKQVSPTDIGETALIGTRLDITAESGSLTVNGYNFTTPAFNFTTPHSLLAFCEYTNGAALNFGAFRYWVLNIWDNGNPVRKFRPVRVGTDATSWEGAMMDTLTRRIYRNAGTGAFGYGNDLPYPIPA